MLPLSVGGLKKRQMADFRLKSHFLFSHRCFSIHSIHFSSMTIFTFALWWDLQCGGASCMQCTLDNPALMVCQTKPALSRFSNAFKINAPSCRNRAVTEHLSFCAVMNSCVISVILAP